MAISDPAVVGDTGNRNSAFHLGQGDHRVAIEFMSGPRADGIVAFPVADLQPARDTFGALDGFDEHVFDIDGDEIRSLRPKASAVSGCNVVVIQYPAAMLDRQADEVDPPHELPLQRLDHLAIIPADFDECTRYWTEVLGVPVVAEHDGPAFLLRQLQAGDLVVELLTPHDRSSPLAVDPPGIMPLIAVEVDDLDACIAHARARGFTVPDAVEAPGRVRSTIDAPQLGGLSIQLLQYV